MDPDDLSSFFFLSQEEDLLMEEGEVPAVPGVPFGRGTVSPSHLMARPEPGTRCRIATLSLLPNLASSQLEYLPETPYLVTPRLWEGRCMLDTHPSPASALSLRANATLDVVDLPSQSPLVWYEVGEHPLDLEDLLVRNLDSAVRLVPALQPPAKVDSRDHLAVLLFQEGYPEVNRLEELPGELRYLLRYVSEVSPQQPQQQELWNHLKNMFDFELAPSEGSNEPEHSLRQRYRLTQDGSPTWPGLTFLRLCRYMPTGRAIYYVNRGQHQAILDIIQRNPFELCWRGVVSPAGLARSLADQGRTVPGLPESQHERAVLFSRCRARIYPLLGQQIVTGQCPPVDRDDEVDSFLRLEGSLVHAQTRRMRPRISRFSVQIQLTEFLSTRPVPDASSRIPEKVSSADELVSQVLPWYSLVLLDAPCSGNCNMIQKLVNTYATVAVDPRLRLSDKRTTYAWLWDGVLEQMRASIRDEQRLPLVVLLHGERWSTDAMSVALRFLVQPLAPASSIPIRLVIVCDMAVPSPTLLWLERQEGVRRVGSVVLARERQYRKLSRLIELAQHANWVGLGELVLAHLSTNQLPLTVAPTGLGLSEEDLFSSAAEEGGWPRRLYRELTCSPDRLTLVPSVSPPALFERMRKELR